MFEDMGVTVKCLADIRHPAEFAAAHDAASRNSAAIQHRAPWLVDLADHVEQVLSKPGSDKALLMRMRRLADRIGLDIAPHAVCREGCSQCCHIAVAMSEKEARLIGAEIGIEPKRKIGGVQEFDEEGRDQFSRSHFGEPCPFLRDGLCSIYESRPLSCRLHFNIGDSPFFCSTDIPPEDSIVPKLALSMFWIGLAAVTIESSHGDIRDFFG